MSSASPATISRINASAVVNTTISEVLPRWRSLPAPTLALTAVFLAFLLCPRVNGNPKLMWSFGGIAGGLFLWQMLLWAVAKRRGQSLRIEFTPVRSHWVQACVQSSIMVYWGWYSSNVVAEAPLIVAQLVFLYILEALLTWSRGRTWRLGFGPMPIVISTNLLLWFRDDWFYLQFLMLTTGALAKQFITWEREGRRMHIFNPSAFGQFLFAVVLIATASTNHLTLGREIATTFEVPHMLVVIFLGGLVVQYLFHVTLMTFAAVCMLCAFNLIYTRVTGTYFFVNINIAAPIFLGVHLLITDPATSPRSNVGRVLFGALYGLGYCILFRVLDYNEVPTFWDKLLPVPILNLAVPLIDRFARSGSVGSLNRRWESALPAGKMNLAHMALWMCLFGTMLGTGFIEGPHPGNSIPFWKKAYDEGKPYAGHNLVMAAGAQAEGVKNNDVVSGAAFNELGLICMEGRIVKENHGTAAKYFARACELGNLNGCANVAIQFLFLHERRSDEDVKRALDQLEQDCMREPDWGTCFLVGIAYEMGRGRPMDKSRATEMYERCGLVNLYAVKGLARIGLSDDGPAYDLTAIARILQAASDSNDAESCWYLAYMHHMGRGVSRDEAKARALMQKACQLGSTEACEAIKQSSLPPFTKPRMLVPGWSSAFPLK